MVRSLPAAGVALLLGACASSSPGLYQWGSYDADLYSTYKNPNQVIALRKNLEAHVAAMESSRRRVAPGLYAELGTLHLQANDLDKAILYYSHERAFWPESNGLMTAMIDNIRRRKEAGRQAAK